MARGKTLVALFTIVMFVMSIPFAAAGKGSDRGPVITINADGNMQTDGDTAGESGSSDENSGPDSTSGDSEGSRQDRLDIRAKLNIENGSVKAGIRDLERARERYEEQKEKYAELRAEFQKEREAFLAIRAELRERLKACAGDSSEECNEVRQELAVKGQPFLLLSGHIMLAILEKVKVRIEAADELSEEEADAMMLEANEKIAAVQAAMELVEQLDEDSTQEDVAEAAAQLRMAWQDAKPVAKVHVNRVSNSRLGGVIVQMERLNARMANVLARMEAKGTTIVDLEAKLLLYNEALAKASAHHKKAIELKADGSKASEELKAAKLELKNARSILQELIHGIKKKAKERPENKSRHGDRDGDDDSNSTEGNNSSTSEEDEDADDDEEQEESDSDDSKEGEEEKNEEGDNDER